MRLIFLCLIGFLFSVNTAFSQVMIPVEITTKNALSDNKEGGIVLKVYDGTTIIKTISSDANGLIKFTIPGGKKYRVEFSKAGKVGRFMIWDFKNVVDEVISGNVIPKMESPMSLFEEVPGIDFSFFKTNPATEFYYDPAVDKEKMSMDMVKSQKTIKKQESLKKEIENLKGQSNAQYNALIKEAQGLEKQEKYTEAIAKYEKASELDKSATLPGEKITELEQLVKAQKGTTATNAQLDQDYKNLVNSANTLRDQGKTEEALDKYEAAYKIKKEQYVLDEIDKCELALKAEKSQGANKVKYDQAMKQGDGFVAQKSWEAAKAKYNEALLALPNDPIAKTKLTDVTNKLNQQKEEQAKQAKFNTAMGAGDALFGQNKYEEAKVKYEEALVHLPGNADATKKKLDCTTKISELQKDKERQVSIDKLIVDGNKAMSENQWLAAKNSFIAVQKLDEKNTIAAAKLIAIDAKIAEEKSEQDKANKVKLLVAEGDAFVKTAKLNEAKAKYDAAYELIKDPAVKLKIDAVVKSQNDIAQKEATKKQFDQLISEGDVALKAGDFSVAKEKFNAAKVLDNSSTIPTLRMAEVDKKETALKAEKEKADQYETLFKSGQAALDASDLALAKTKFEAAYNLDKTKTAAKEKLDFVTKQINDKNAVAAMKAKYDAAYKAGVDFQQAGKLTEAKAKFIEAKSADPSQTGIQEKINEVDGLIAKQNQQKQLSQLISEGNAALGKADLTLAKAKFEAVKKLDPNNTQASEGLQTIANKEAELILKEQQLKEQQLREQQLKEQQLKDQQLKEQQLKEQQLKEQQLKEQQLKEQQLKEQQLKEQQLKEQQLKEQQLKEQQLKEQQLKEQQLKEQQLKEQQLKEQQLKEQQLKEQQLKEQQLKEQQLKEQQLKEQQLKEQQLKEQQLKEQLLKEQQLKEQQLKEQQLKEQQLKEQQLKEQQQQLEAKNYEKLIADAQSAFDNRDYEKAVELFESASKKRPEDSYAIEKLAVSKDLLEKEKLKKAALSSYTNKMQLAESAVIAEKYDEAIALFNAAKQLNPNQDVTDKRIKDVKTLQEKEASNLATANLLLDQQKELMNKAKVAESNKQFDVALNQYEAADKILPGDKTISGKINEMKQLLDNQKTEQQQKLAKEQLIIDLLKKADDFYKVSKWNEAKLAYEKVLQQDESNSIALKRQQSCLDNLAKKTATEEEEAYQSIVSKANENFDKKDFKNAKKLYDRALKLRPSDKFVIAQLNKLNNRNKPTPPVTTPQQPVEVPVKKEPQPLADLGVKSEISLQDAQAKLEAADKARKNKKATNLTEELKGLQTNDGDLQLNQQANISTNKSTINAIVLAADIPEDTSDVSRHLNRAVVDAIYGYQQGVTTNNQLVERSELYYQKEQIDLATNSVSDQNSILDGKGIENEQIIRKERVVRENVTIQKDETEVNQNEHTTQDFMTIRLKNEQKEIDESLEKAEFTAQINVLKKADENKSIASQEKQHQATYAVKDVLNNATNVVTTKQEADSKLPGINSDLLIKTEKNSQDQQGVDQLNRQNYLQGIKGDLNKEAGVIANYDDSMLEKRLDNATTLASEKKELTDKNESDQSDSHDKSIGNKTSINSAKVDVIPDTLSAAATVRLVNELVSKEQETASTAQANQAEKQQENKKTIEGSVASQEETAAGLNDADNISQLKTVAKDLENNVGVQLTAAQDKRLESKKVLDAMYKKEAKFTDKLANDLGSIYPEGVSQDQFEILGHDGLVSGIATRRIVVKNGRGAVYVRTQSMTAITYSKNGQACTELVWQRETQDALLKRNY
jgi:epidermal growth factor receptor substrate 15